MTSHSRAPLQLAMGALVLATAPIFAKDAMASGLSPTVVALWRMSIGAAVLLLIAGLRRPRHRLSRREHVTAFVAGVVFAADLWFWHRSIAATGAGMSTILGNTQVFWTAALGRLLLHESLSRRSLVAVPLAFGGVVLLAGAFSDVRFERPYLIGVLQGVATGVCYATYLIVLATSGRSRATATGPRPDRLAQGVTILLGICVWTAITLVPLVILEGGALMPSGWRPAMSLLGTGLLPQVLGWLLIFDAMSAVPASHAALILLLQPTAAMVLGVWLFGEQLLPLQTVGALVTLVAIYLGGTARAAPGRVAREETSGRA